MHNLGPLQLLAMAPFVHLDPFWGAALGVGIVNLLSVLAVFFAARRLFGVPGVVGVMGTTLVLEACFGQEAWIDPRQQLALLLPFWAFIWLTVAMVEGVDAVLFPWVLAGSFVANVPTACARRRWCPRFTSGCASTTCRTTTPRIF